MLATLVCPTLNYTHSLAHPIYGLAHNRGGCHHFKWALRDGYFFLPLQLHGSKLVVLEACWLRSIFFCLGNLPKVFCSGIYFEETDNGLSPFYHFGNPSNRSEEKKSVSSFTKASFVRKQH